MKIRKISFLQDKKHAPGRIDHLLLLSVIMLSLFGTVMVSSAGYAYAYARYGDALYFVKRQIVWLTVGFLVMYVASRIPIDVYKKYTPYAYALTAVLLVLVLLVGFVGNGAQR